MRDRVLGQSDVFKVSLERSEDDHRNIPDANWELVVSRQVGPGMGGFDDNEKRIRVDDDVAGWITKYIPEGENE